MTITAGLALALTLTACGSDKADDNASGDKATTSSASTGAATPTTGGSDGSADEQWAARFKTAIPPLANTPDADLVTDGKKMCTDFTAAPTPVTAKAIIKDAETTLKLNSAEANLWTGGAIAHFCNDQGTAFLAASVG